MGQEINVLIPNISMLTIWCIKSFIPKRFFACLAFPRVSELRLMSTMRLAGRKDSQSVKLAFLICVQSLKSAPNLL